MRVFAKRAFQFDHPTNAADPVIVQMDSFNDVPDWVEDSTMFKLASLDESVLVIESKQDELKAEKGANDKTSRAHAKKEAEDANAAAAAAGSQQQ